MPRRRASIARAALHLPGAHVFVCRHTCCLLLVDSAAGATAVGAFVCVWLLPQGLVTEAPVFSKLPRLPTLVGQVSGCGGRGGRGSTCSARALPACCYPTQHPYPPPPKHPAPMHTCNRRQQVPRPLDPLLPPPPARRNTHPTRAVRRYAALLQQFVHTFPLYWALPLADRLTMLPFLATLADYASRCGNRTCMHACAFMFVCAVWACACMDFPAALAGCALRCGGGRHVCMLECVPSVCPFPCVCAMPCHCPPQRVPTSCDVTWQVMQMAFTISCNCM